ncbi:PTS sugar transporter subunit IIA [Thermophilibacter provencensis]|uniref:PTS sugar transporter subunit IIA n=1 Tax=Thermophilibacter provencensis TaxID=1852386 RepID=UPI002357AFD1|nr:PTS sugar transporter subunit IIA [Thermophilibacter provencensis]
MNQIVLASHGGLADGARDTLDMIIGDVSNVHTISLARDDKDQIEDRALALIDSFDPSDAVYVLTDMLGSSVNNQMVSLKTKRPEVTVISGMNLPLILEIALSDEPLSEAALAEVIKQSRAGIQDIAALMRVTAQQEEEDDL